MCMLIALALPICEVQLTDVPAAFVMMSVSEVEDGAEPGKGSMEKYKNLLAGGTPQVAVLPMVGADSCRGGQLNICISHLH